MFERLKVERNAVIMAHYYQEPDIQDIADVLGDSLLLAREAQKTDADVIVLCGVHFMAETADLLSAANMALKMGDAASAVSEYEEALHLFKQCLAFCEKGSTGKDHAELGAVLARNAAVKDPCWGAHMMRRHRSRHRRRVAPLGGLQLRPRA